MFDLCAVGDLSWLVILPVPHLPHAGEVVVVKNSEHLLGNDAATVSFLAARLGLRSCLLATNSISRRDGLPLLDLLQQEGVDISRINTDGASTPTTYFLQCKDVNERAGLVEAYPFYNHAAAQLPASTFAYLDVYEEYTDERLALIEMWSTTHVRSFINLSDSRIMEKAQLLANISSLDTLQMASSGSVADARVLGRRILEICRTKCAVVTLGSVGAVLIEQQDEYFVSAEAIQPVRTIGAGASFSAGFLCALARGATHREAATFASKYAATFCTLERNPLEVEKR